jgi:hypothetical protein
MKSKLFEGYSQSSSASSTSNMQFAGTLDMHEFEDVRGVVWGVSKVGTSLVGLVSGPFR